MSYIGRAPGFGIRNRYYYTATASQTTFSGADDNGQTLAYADSKYLDVFLNGVSLVAGTDYTATTLTSITLTSGASADDIIEIVAYDIFSVADTVSAANGGTFNGDITIDSTGFLGLPSGTTAQRPGSPAAGYVRHNTDFDALETYDGSAWVFVGNQSAVYDVEYLVVAGGGAGGNGNDSGGGGAGGYRSSVAGESSGGGASAEDPLSVQLGTTYTVTIGAGAAAGSNGNGSNSIFHTITSLGGGGGGFGTGGGGTVDGQSGGSGGGGDNDAGAGGSGTSGQGFNGGTGGGPDFEGGGGGGAGQAGANAPSGSSKGGDGVQSSINGTATYRAGGGGGGGETNPGAGGLGGGGAGTATTVGNNGQVNTGGGGGAVDDFGTGGGGGSGVVILRMATVNYSGTTTGSPTVTTDGTDTILTYTSSGTYTA